MLIESSIGKYHITAANDESNVIVSADDRFILVSILDAVELMGGAIGEDNSFSLSDISPYTLFGKQRFEITLTRTQLARYFQYEILNFLNYKSLTQMRKSL